MKHFPGLVTIGYLLIFCCIGLIGYAYYYEWIKLDTLEQQNRETNKMQEDIIDFNIAFSEFSLAGEGLFKWGETDRSEYIQKHKSLDSVLHYFNTTYPTIQIDSLRRLLKDKVNGLLKISQILEIQQKANDEIVRDIPYIRLQSTQEASKKPKRKGFLGLFGKKEEIQPEATTLRLQKQHINTVSQHTNRTRRLQELTDSLIERNRKLNAQLNLIMQQLDNRARKNIRDRENNITFMRHQSYQQIGGLSLALIVLLILSYLIILRDIRYQKRVKKQLEESIRQNELLLEMRKKIILTISHDIRGPLNVISGSAELAISTRDKKKRDSYLNNARDLCRHVVHLLNNLLDVYRLNEAKEIPNYVPFRLNIMLDRIAIGAAQIINDKGLLFKHDYKNVNVTVIGDEDKIEQIADNLLSNAVKFTQSGSVGIVALYEDCRLVMDINDTGIGMSEETVKRIFKPFERADNVEHVEGFGLGLSITKGLVAMLGGTIDVMSTVGKGTTFHITIPLELTNNMEFTDTLETKPASVLRLPHNVIVIDDDPLQYDIIREMLERNAVSCTVCATASDVVKAMRKLDYDILLTDINMPGTNGVELLELLRKSNIGNSKKIPVVAMTARDDDESRPLIQRGFSGCIFKPFSMQELLERISIIMAKPLPLSESRIAFAPLIFNVTDKSIILQSLAESIIDDIEELKRNLEKNDLNGISSVIHRIMPVWEMLGIQNRLYPLRNAVKTRNVTATDIKYLVTNVISAMENLIENITEELEKIKDEEQDTNS